LAAAHFEIWQVVVNVAARHSSSPSTPVLPSIVIPLIQNSHIRSSATAIQSLISDNVVKQTFTDHFFICCSSIALPWHLRVH